MPRPAVPPKRRTTHAAFAVWSITLVMVLAQHRAVVSTSEAVIAALKLEIALLKREQYGRSAERTARLIDQLELQLEELETAATEDAIQADQGAAKTGKVTGFDRRHPVKKPFPADLPRERVVIEAPAACTCCGSAKIVKMGEDVTETLEVVPRHWKVIQTVREKFTCRDCEKISQPPAPFHPVSRGWAGPNLLAMIAFEAVRRINALFDIERDINGLSPADRLAARQRLSALLIEDLQSWLKGERALLSKHAKVAKAIDYLLSPDHWPGFTEFLRDGRVCLTAYSGVIRPPFPKVSGHPFR